MVSAYGFFLGLGCPSSPAPSAGGRHRNKGAREAARDLLKFGYPSLWASRLPTSVPQPPERPQITASGSPAELSIPTTEFLPSGSFLCPSLTDAVIMSEGML